MENAEQGMSWMGTSPYGRESNPSLLFWQDEPELQSG
jgi:hypothetical protein